MSDLVIVEGVESMWRYHIAPSDRTGTSLCGRATMRTGIPLVSYGKSPRPYHIPEHWCDACKVMAQTYRGAAE